MVLTKEQLEFLIDQTTSLKNKNNDLENKIMILQNTIIGLARILNVPTRQFAEAMLGGRNNSEYEQMVTADFRLMTGRQTNDIDNVVAQEVKKNKRK